VSSDRCGRVALTTETKRRLWSESAGYCLNPSCAQYLFADGSDADFAEMAHIIPASTGGPRDIPTSELSGMDRAHHSNIAVLCANCHTIVDKDPGAYPSGLMIEWKRRHQVLFEQVLGAPIYASRSAALDRIAPLLAANRLIYERYGPKNDEFSESKVEQWRRHVRDTIVPNNRTILRVLENNKALLLGDEAETVSLFQLHVREFEYRHILNDWTAGSSRFPEGMKSILDGAR
jgi:hypothetical protein